MDVLLVATRESEPAQGFATERTEMETDVQYEMV